MDYELKRSPRRRTVALEVRDARLRVRAPVGVSRADLDQLVRQKRAWIERKRREQSEQLARIPDYRYQTGTRLPWLDGELTLECVTGPRAGVERRGERLCVRCSRRSRRDPEAQVRALVRDWYRQAALSELTARTQALAARLGLRHTGVRVRATRSKWGHCTSRGEIQYNWQILLAPASVVDYLVAHEVCHLRHPNHSRAFWELVGSVCPDYRRQRDWLKTNGRCLVL